MTDALARALSFAKYVGPVHPCRDKAPQLPHPLEQATRDLEQIATWWSGEFAGAQVGFYPAQAEVVVVDIDAAKGDETDGRTNLRAAGIKPPATLTYKTPSGGRHRIYRAPAGRALAPRNDTPVPRVDIRAANGNVIYYGPELTEAPELAPAPEWALIAAKRTAPRLGSDVPTWMRKLRKGDPRKAARNSAKRIKLDGTTHDTLLEVTSDLARRGALGEPGIRLLLERARARYVAHYPDSARHFDNALEGAVEYHGAPLKTSKSGKAKPPKIEASAGADVLDEVRHQVRRFVALPSEHHEVAVALWTAHVHLIGCFDNTPRLWLHSPEPGSGKTRALEVVAKMTPDPIEAQNVSVAYLARKLDETGGTSAAFLDEIDTVLDLRVKNASQEELRGILNAGYRRGATYGRAAVRGKVVVTEDIACFAPVALAGLGDIPDTIRTRAVAIPMRRRANDEQIEPFRQRVNGPELEVTRDRLAGWARSVRKIVAADPELPEGIADRDADVWEPLVAVADAAGGDWPRLAREAAVALVTASRERPTTLGIRLLADVRTILTDRDRITVFELLHELYNVEDGPWEDLGGKGAIAGKYLGRKFTDYDIRPARTIRPESSGSVTARGWLAIDFADAFRRYLPPTLTTFPIDRSTP